MERVPFARGDGVSRRSIVKAIQSLQQRAFEHEDKINRAPNASAAASWRQEVAALESEIQDLEQHLL